MKDLAKEQRDFQVYLRMGSAYCPPCVYDFIADGRPFVNLREDGTYQNHIRVLRFVFLSFDMWRVLTNETFFKIRDCRISIHRQENFKKLCNCTFPQKWQTCKFCKHPRAGTQMRCNECNHLFSSEHHQATCGSSADGRRLVNRIVDDTPVKRRKPTLNTYQLCTQQPPLPHRPEPIRVMAGPQSLPPFPRALISIIDINNNAGAFSVKRGF